jgi:hypothetical protein
MASAPTLWFTSEVWAFPRQLDADRPNFLFAREFAGTGYFGENVDKPAR